MFLIIQKGEDLESLDKFIDDWGEDSAGNKRAFVYFREVLAQMEGVVLEFIEREGITYSLRAKHSLQSKKPLFVMVDVIEAEPRWLSVCFYAEMIDDPEARGDFVPGGLLGEDAVCFDVEGYSDEINEYLRYRIKEAALKAAEC